MVVTELSQSEELRVLSTDRIYQILERLNRLDDRITSFEVVREVADHAGVGTVLLGSVAKVGEQIRISIKIQEAATGSILGAKRVDGIGQENLFSMVDELGLAIRKSLEVTEVPDAPPGPTMEELATSSIEAFRLWSEGYELFNEAKYEEVISLNRQALEIDPDFAKAHYALSVTFGIIGFQQLSQRHMMHAFELREELGEEHRLVIEAKHYDDRDETVPKALETYRQLRTLAPWRNFEYAGLLNRLERYEEAIEVAEEAIAEGTDRSAGSGVRALSHTSLAEFENARQLLEDLLQREPRSYLAHRAAGDLYLKWGRLDDAQRAYETADSLRPMDFRITAGLSTVAILRDNFDEASRIARPLLGSTSPVSQARALTEEAIVLLLRGHTVEAERLLEQRIGLGLDSVTRASFRNHLAEFYLLRGEPELALEHLEQALEEGINERLNRALHLSALAHMRSGDATAAEEKADALKVRADQLPSDRVKRRWHRLQGELALERGKTGLAISELGKAQEMLPPGPKGVGAYQPHVPIWYSLANAYLVAGDDGEAEEWFSRIVNAGFLRRTEPIRWARSHHLLAQIHERRGDTAKARQLYRRFYELWRDGDIDRDWVEEARRKSDL
jgi:tetratricopeptide (TPR) repeat protein